MKQTDHLIQRFEELKTERSNRESEWRQIAYYMRPTRQEMRSFYLTGETRPDQDPYISDSTAAVAVDNFVGGVFGFMSNPANQWFALETFDDDLNQFHSAKEWLYRTTSIVLRSFGPAFSPFYSEVPELYADCPCFGTGVFYSEYRTGQNRIHDKCFPLSEIVLDTNNYGEVDTVYRRMLMTGRQAAQQFGLSNLSPRAIGLHDRSSPDKFEIIHVVYPNSDRVPGRLGLDGFGVVEAYIEIETRHLIQQSGRDQLPYQVPRWQGTGKYGFGLGWRNLPDAKMIVSMDNAFLESLEMRARPPILAASEDQIETLRPIPRGVSYGGLTPSGRRLVDFLEMNGSLPDIFQTIEARREQLRDAWFFSLMQLVGRTGMTATEVLERQEEKMRLMGPHLARLQIEFLSPLIMRRFDMLERRGLLPEPPEDLRGKDLRIEYVSPMAKAQKAAEAQSTMRAIDALAAISALDPTAADKLNGDRAAESVREGFGAPARIFNSPEELQAKREARAQAQAQAQQLAAAEMASKAAKNVGLTVPQEGARAR